MLRSSLVRRLPLKSRSFQILFWVSLATGVIFGGLEIYQNHSLKWGLLQGGSKAFAVLLTWIFARELDPDSKMEAFYGIVPLLVTFFFYDELSTLPCLFILFCMRMVTRSAGQNPSIADFLFLLFFAIFIYFTESFIFLLFGGIYILTDSRSKGGGRKGLPFSFFMILIATLSFVNLYTVEPVQMELIPMLLAGWITVMFAYRLSALKYVFSMDDTNRYYLSPKRIKNTGILTLLLAIMLAVNTGMVFQIAPLWFAMLGVSMPFLKMIQRRSIDVSDVGR